MIENLALDPMNLIDCVNNLLESRIMNITTEDEILDFINDLSEQFFSIDVLGRFIDKDVIEKLFNSIEVNFGKICDVFESTDFEYSDKIDKIDKEIEIFKIRLDLSREIMEGYTNSSK